MQLLIDQSVEEFIQTLEKPTIAKILRTIDLLEQFGYQLGMPHSKKMTHDLYELRIRGKQEVRVIYTFHKKTIVLLHGFIKKTQQIPRKEIVIAEKRRNNIDDI